MHLSAKENLVADFLKTHPQSAAKVLIGSSTDQLAKFAARYPAELIASSLETLPAKLLADSFEQMEDSQISGILPHLSPNLVSGILRQWIATNKKERAESILGALEANISRPIRSLLDYPAGSVGSLMNTVPFSVPSNLSVREVLSLLKKQKNHYSRFIYVTDPNSSLIGVFPFKDTYYSNKEDIISSIMTSSVLTLNPETSALQALSNPAWKNWSSMPVTTSQGKLLGIIRHSDLEKYISKEDAKTKTNEELSMASAAVGEVFKIGIGATIATLGISLKDQDNA